jgi:hypothetical protein
MTLKNKIIAGSVLATLALGSIGYFGIKSRKEYLTTEFQRKNTSIVATVLAEEYQNTLSPNPEKHINGLVSEAYSNETVKLDSKYTLKVETDDGRILGVSVIDSMGTINEGAVKKESLDILIKTGSRISFPSGNWNNDNFTSRDRIVRSPSETDFTENTQYGTKRADRITVLSY